MTNSVDYQKEDAVAWITLNRPEKLNALLQPMMDHFLELLKEVEEDQGVRAVVITAVGRGFCTGEDISWIIDWAKDFREHRKLVPAPSGKMPSTILKLSKPTIAAVNGVAVGVGCDIALACDFRIASENAKFGEMYIKRGITPGLGLWLLPRIVGLPKAIEMCMLGEMIDATEAKEIGLANKVVPADKLHQEAQALAGRLAQGPPLALRFCKDGIYKALGMDYSSFLELSAYQRFVQQQGPEVPEGWNAFYEKREPKF